MPAWRPLAIVGGAACAAVAAAMLVSPSAQAELPPGYVPVPGTVPINPAHVPTMGSQFTQICIGLPRPVQPGEVAWHFILPQSLQRPGTPVNVFDTLMVTFQTAGPITLSAVTEFGPPSNAHAYVFTPTDDTLTAGSATIGREIAADPLIANDPQFNLSHTCASTTQPTTTTTTTAPTTTTTAPTTTTIAPTTTTTTAAHHDHRPHHDHGPDHHDHRPHHDHGPDHHDHGPDHHDHRAHHDHGPDHHDRARDHHLGRSHQRRAHDAHYERRRVPDERCEPG